MKKAWNEKKTNNLKEQALQLIQKNEKLERRIATLQGNDKAETMKSTKKGDDESEKIQICIKSPLKSNNQSEDQNESCSTLALTKISDSEEEGADEDKKKLISSKRKRTRVRKTKRCHLCRKRGHIKRDCMFSLVLQN